MSSIDDPCAQAAALARAHVAGREDIYDPAVPFPFDIWAALGKAGMLGLGLPREYGGGGCGYPELLAVCGAFVQAGRNPGLASAWLSQTLIGRLILGASGSEAQKREYMPRLATGALIAAVAISEPGAGAHPKRLSATAVRDGGDWVLNGDKAWITNGPVAGLYIVLAVSAESGGRKQFSAYLVARETQGLSQTDAGSVDFLRPVKHGGLRLQNCRVPVANMIGPEGQAFETISKPIREVEDILGLGIGLGGRAAQLDLLRGLIDASASQLTGEQFESLGALQATQAALRILAYSLADGLDQAGGADPTAPLLAAKRLARQFQTDFSDCVKSLQLPENMELSRLSRDLTKLADLASGVDRAKAARLGKSLIQNED